MTPTGFALHFSSTANTKTKDQHLNPCFISRCHFRCSFPLVRRGNAKSVTVNAITSVWLMFGAWAFLFVFFFQPSHLLLRRKLDVFKKPWVRRSHRKSCCDNKAEVKWHQSPLVCQAHAHPESHLLDPDNSFARGTTNGSARSRRNQLQHTCLLLSNSLLLFPELRWPQAAGDRDTCNSSHPLAQIATPFFVFFFFLRLC